MINMLVMLRRKEMAESELRGRGLFIGRGKALGCSYVISAADNQQHRPNFDPDVLMKQCVIAVYHDSTRQ